MIKLNDDHKFNILFLNQSNIFPENLNTVISILIE